MANSLNVCTLNVNGLNDFVKRKKVFKWLQNNRIDVALLQETHCKENQANYFSCSWSGSVIHGCSDSNHSRGVAIMFRRGLDLEIIDCHKSENGRLLLANSKIAGELITFVCVYAPNQEKPRKDFFNKCIKWIRQYSMNVNSLIIGGDFNCCLRDIDRSSATNMNDSSRNGLFNLMRELSLTDIWHKIHPNSPGYTWSSSNTGNTVFSRLDYIMVSAGMPFKQGCVEIKTVISSQIGKRITDHKALVHSITISDNHRGPGYWKLNASFLLDDVYIEKVKIIIRNTLYDETIDSNMIKWELFKLKVKEFSIRYGVSKAREKDTRIKNLEKQRDELSPEDTDHRKILENELSDIYNEKVIGARIRSRAKWYEQGEKSSKYFMGLENRHQSSNVIRALNSDGTTFYDDKNLLETISSFYEKLYTSKSPDMDKIETYIHETNLNALTNDQKSSCDAPLTLQQLKTAVFKMKRNKSPGSDGLTIEFYQKFWDSIKYSLLDSYNESLEQGELTPSQRYAIISLMFKKGDRKLLKNYRPISLTNCDYKILALTLATRMQTVISDLVNEEQTACIKNRNIAMNARMIADIFEYAESSNTSGALLMLDFEKAFDSIEWPFIMNVLKKMNFGPLFLKWIKILYTMPCFSVKNNGWISIKKPMTRGIRQGCPISALLFVLTVEVMSQRIRDNVEISGFKFMNREIKIAQHADDAALTLTKIESIPIALKEIEDFGSVSGLTLNLDKTEGIWVGGFKDNDPSMFNIKWTKESVRYLGIFIGHDTEECCRMNWDTKVDNLKKTLQIWKMRQLSLFGKVLIVKSFAISKIIYTASILIPHDDFIKRVNKIIYDFLFNNNCRIKRKTLSLDLEEGGIKMVDLEKKMLSLQAAWASRLLTYNGRWSDIFKHYSGKLNLSWKYLLKLKFTSVEMFPFIKCLPPFYQQVLVATNKCKKQVHDHLSFYSLLSDTIWGNPAFQFKNKTLFFTNWIESGFLYVRDLCINGKFITEDHVLTVLQYKHNWISEYVTLSKIFKRKINKFNSTVTPYINTEKVPIELVKGNKSRKPRYFYNLLMQEKKIYPISQKFWNLKFQGSASQINWISVYKTKIKQMLLPKIAEFNFKLLHMILPCGYLLSKWNRNINTFCNLCPDSRHTVEHMLWFCQPVSKLWKVVGIATRIDIKWDMLVIRSMGRDTDLLFSMINYSVFKSWTRNNVMLNFENLAKFIKQELLFYKECQSYMKKDLISNKLLIDIINIL